MSDSPEKKLIDLEARDDLSPAVETAAQALEHLGDTAVDTEGKLAGATAAAEGTAKAAKQLSDLAGAAEKELSRVSSSATAATREIGKYGASADDLTRAQSKIARIEAEHARAQDNRNKALAAGGRELEQFQRILDGYTGKLRAAERAEADLAREMDAARRTVEGQAGAIGAAEAAWLHWGGSITRMVADARSLKDELDPIGAVYRRLGADLQRFTDLEKEGFLVAAQRIALTEKYTAAAKAQEAELNGTAEAGRRRAADEAQAAKNAQRAQEDAARAAAKAQADLNAQAKAFIAVADPAAAAQARLNEQTAIADRLLAAGLITRAQHTAGLQVFRQETEQAAASGGAAANAMRQLGLQSLDVFQQLASGAPVMTTLVQQGGQLAQATMASGAGFGVLREAATTALAALISPAGLAITAIAAVAAGATAMAIAAESAERRMRALRTTLQATRADSAVMADITERAARNLGSSTTMSTVDARQAATAFAQQPTFAGSQQQLEDLVRTAHDAATVLGVDFVEAANRMAMGIREPISYARELENRIAGFNTELTNTVEGMVRSGKTAEAFTLIFDRLKTRVHGASEAMQTELQRELTNLSNALTRTGTDGKSLADTIGTAIGGAAADAVSKITWLIETINKLRAMGTPGAATSSQWSMPSMGDVYRWIADRDPRRMLWQAAPGVAGWVAGQVTAPAAPMAPHPTVAGSVQASAAVTGLDPAFLGAVQASEGVYDNATGTWRASSAGALGPMQVKPATFAGIARQHPDLNLTDVTNTDQNVRAGAAHLADLLAKYGSWQLAVLAYHDGESAIDEVLRSNGTRVASADARAQVRRIERSYAGTGRMETVMVRPDVGPDLPIPPIPPSGRNSTGVVDDADQLIRAADDKARQGSWSENRRVALENVQDFTQALDLLAQKGITSGEQVERLRDALRRAAKEAGDALPPVALLSRGIDDQVKANQALADAYAKGPEAVADVTAAIKAEEAARTLAARGAGEYEVIKARLIRDYKTEAQSITDVAFARKAAENNDQVALIQAEVSALGMAAEQRAVYLAHIRAELELKRENKDLEAASSQAYIASAEAVARSTFQLEQHRAALAEVEQAVTSIVDNIANALSQAFLTGAGQAVNWGNTLKAIAAQVLGEFAKLAVLNPILNSMFGGNRQTIGTVAAALGAGAAGNGGASGDTASGGGSLLGSLGNLWTGAGALDTLGLTNIKGWLSGIGESVGLTGNGGVLSGVSGILSTPLWGATAGIEGASSSAIAAATAPSGLLSEAAVAGNMGLTSSVGSAGVTLGGALAGIGGGFALGTMAGGYTQSAMGKTGYGPMIGAGLGAGAGFLVGGPVGALIGGALGGAGGGLIGPNLPSAYSSTGLSINAGGQLAIGQTVSQGTDTAQEVAALQNDVAALNALLAANGIRTASTGGIQIGQNTPGETPDPTKYANLAGAFGQLRFTADDPIKAAAIGDKSFASLQDLATAIQAVAASAEQTTTFLDETVPALLKAGEASQAFAQQLASVAQPYDDAIAQAKAMAEQAGQAAERIAQLSQAQTDLATARDTAVVKAIDDAVAGLVPAEGGAQAAQMAEVTKRYDDAIAAIQVAAAKAGDSATVTDRLAKAEADLTAAREKAIDAANEAVHQAERDRDRALAVRMTTVDANTSGDPYRIQGARLMAMDEQARLERQTLDQQLVATYGDAFRLTEDYAQRMTQLEHLQMVERQAAQDDFARKMVATERSLADQRAALVLRQATAEAALAEDPAQAQAATLAGRDEQARLERQALEQQLVDTYGEGIRATQLFADMMVQLDRTQHAERLAAQKQFTDQAIAQEKAAAEKAAGILSNLADFGVQLQTGPLSALSVPDQYAVARTQFDATREKARAGGVDALGGLQNAITTLLNASRALNGSGAAYSADFNEVLATIRDLGAMDPAALTASVFVTETRSAADRIVEALAALRDLPTATATPADAAPGAGVSPSRTVLPASLTDVMFMAETRAATAAIVDAITRAGDVANDNAAGVIAAIGALATPANDNRANVLTARQVRAAEIGGSTSRMSVPAALPVAAVAGNLALRVDASALAPDELVHRHRHAGQVPISNVSRRTGQVDDIAGIRTNLVHPAMAPDYARPRGVYATAHPSYASASLGTPSSTFVPARLASVGTPMLAGVTAGGDASPGMVRVELPQGTTASLNMIVLAINTLGDRVVAALRELQAEVKKGNQDATTRNLLPSRVKSS